MRPLNPVLRRELVERWRGRRAGLTLTAYLSALGLGLYGLYRLGQVELGAQSPLGGFDSGSAAPLLGRYLLEGLLSFILSLVLFIAPGYAAAQVSGERERRTLGLLQVTLLRPWQIVAGKLGAAVAWLTLLVVAAAPLGAAAFFLGGVAPGDLLRGIALILGVAVGLAGIGIGMSSLVRRTITAVLLTYTVVFALVVGTTFAALVQVRVSETRGQPAQGTPLALSANPFVGLADALRVGGFGVGMSVPPPLGMFGQLLPFSGQGAGWFALTEGEAAGDLGAALEDETEQEPVWPRVIGVHAGLGLIGLAVATRRLGTGGRRRRWRRRRGAGTGAAAPTGAAAAAQAGGRG